MTKGGARQRGVQSLKMEARPLKRLSLDAWGRTWTAQYCSADYASKALSPASPVSKTPPPQAIRGSIRVTYRSNRKWPSPAAVPGSWAQRD